MFLPFARGQWSSQLLLGVALWGGLGCLRAAGSAAAGVTASGLWQQSYEIWHVDQEWEQGSVTSIVQTRDGYLWLGTYHGLVRFDGDRFTVFDASTTKGGLVNGLVTSLYEDPSGTLWIGHETGQLARFAHGEFQNVNLAVDRRRRSVIEAITSDENGDVWVLQDTGWLFRVRDGQAVEAPGGASPTRKVVLTRAEGGQLWVAANGTVEMLQQGQLTSCPFAAGETNSYFERVAAARDGGLWVMGNGRLRKWRQNRWVGPEAALEPSMAGAITVVHETRSGALLIGTQRDGLYRLTPGQSEVQQFSLVDGLSQNWVRTLSEDHEGNIWIGTGSGFDGLRPRKVQMVMSDDRWQGYAIRSFAVEPEGALWVGTEGAGLYRYESGKWTSYGESNGLSNPYVWSVLETRERSLYVGTWGGGLFIKNGDHFESPGELSHISQPVPALFESRDGAIWIGTKTGLQKYQNGRLTLVAGEDRLVQPDIRAIAESADGVLWFGMSGGGLGRLQDGFIKQFRQSDGLGSDQIVSLYADSDAALWIGSSDNGLTRFKYGKFAVVTDRQGLPSKIISHIVDDGAGNFWLGSHRGILRVSKADLNRCADGLTATVHCLSYGKEEGLTSIMCAGGFQPGACQDQAGRVWFPTARGLAIVDPANATTNDVAPPVQIEEVSVDNVPLDGKRLAAAANGPTHTEQTDALMSRSYPLGRSAVGPSAGIPEDEPLRFGPGRRRFEFQYAALSFLARAKVKFKYKLEGLDPDWLDAGPKRTSPYNYLPSGHYIFRVIACNNDNVWNEQGASFAFTVLPYFWETWWFDTGAVVAGAGLVGAGVLSVARRRERRKLELLERQRALERERARIARDIHDDLGASLTRIGMLSQSARSELEGQPEAAADVDQIYQTARELTRAMDEIVWAVNPKHDTLDSLVTYVGRFAQQYLSAANVRCRLDVPVTLPSWSINAEVRHNVFLAVKEALNNVIKHAHATEARIALEVEPDAFVLLVADNGRGFEFHQPLGPGQGEDTGRVASGNGLLNIQKRLEELGGSAEWDTAPGEGTRLKLRVAIAR